MILLCSQGMRLDHSTTTEVLVSTPIFPLPLITSSHLLHLTRSVSALLGRVCFPPTLRLIGKSNILLQVLP